MAGAMVMIVGFFCIGIAVALTVVILYLITLQKALSRVSPQNRLMEPGRVWLSLIPLFNIVWAFFIATRVPDSLRNEFRARGQDDGSDYGKTIGLINASLGLLWTVVDIFLRMSGIEFREIEDVPPLMLVAGGASMILSLVLLIIFWVKIANYSNMLSQPAFSGFDTSDEYYGRRSEPREGGGPDAGPPDAYRPDDRDQYR